MRPRSIRRRVAFTAATAALLARGLAAVPADATRSSAPPLWAQVDRDIRRHLDEGEFGSAFPGELALVEAYGVSRQTVREALRRLGADGVVTAERGRASRPAQTPDIRQALGALYSLFASLAAQGLEQRSLVRADRFSVTAQFPARRGYHVDITPAQSASSTGREDLAHP